MNNAHDLKRPRIEVNFSIEFYIVGCVCVCVIERERERERQTEKGGGERDVCLCMHVYEREIAPYHSFLSARS